MLAGILDNGKIRGIRCSFEMRRRILDSVDREFMGFLPRVPPSLYSVKFIPVAYRQTDRERREGRRTFLDDTYVIEISVKAGEKGELYETCKHEVFVRRESSVQGPLNPLQIKDIVLSKYRAKIEERRIAKLMSAEKEERSAETTKKESSKNYTPKPSSLKKVVVISP